MSCITFSLSDVNFFLFDAHHSISLPSSDTDMPVLTRLAPGPHLLTPDTGKGIAEVRRRQEAKTKKIKGTAITNEARDETLTLQEAERANEST